ncbi:hypothetical protein J4226_01520 [Candidatus Pacearchaeota archaeon]|nr:hypothetical protein [Candidatus Pacearchaeota archaeon]
MVVKILVSVVWMGVSFFEFGLTFDLMEVFCEAKNLGERTCRVSEPLSLVSFIRIFGGFDFCAMMFDE